MLPSGFMVIMALEAALVGVEGDFQKQLIPLANTISLPKSVTILFGFQFIISLRRCKHLFKLPKLLSDKSVMVGDVSPVLIAFFMRKSNGSIPIFCARISIV